MTTNIKGIKGNEIVAISIFDNNDVVFTKKLTKKLYINSTQGITKTIKLSGNRIYETKGIKNKLNIIDKKLISDDILITIGKLIIVDVKDIKTLLYRKLLKLFSFFNLGLINKIPKTIMYDSKQL